jgi:hypothetical protein
MFMRSLTLHDLVLCTCRALIRHAFFRILWGCDPLLLVANYCRYISSTLARSSRTDDLTHPKIV